MTLLTEPKVQSYVDSVTGFSEWTAMAVPGRTFIAGKTSSGTVWTLYNFLTGAQISRVTLTDIGGTGFGDFSTEPGSMIQDPSGNMWMFNNGIAGLGFNEIYWDPVWSIPASWGALAGVPPAGCPASASLAFLTMGTTHWLVNGAFLASGHGNVTVMRADPPPYPTGNFGFWGHAYTATVDSATFVCAGPQSAASATAYWTSQLFQLGKTVISAGADTYSVTTWPTPNADIASTLIKTYVPTDFDAAWTHITFFSGPGYDQTDGNLILMVATTDAVTNKQYIVKVSATTGAVLWSVAVAQGGGFDAAAVTNARIVFGTFLYWAQTSTFGGTCYAINTFNGAVQMAGFTGLLSLGKQVSDDVLGCVTGECQWDQTHGAIVVLNGTAPIGGVTLATIYFGTPGGGGGGAGLPYDAVRRCWTFELDGHTFYVLQLGATQGTWVYDSTTTEWAKWDTSTYGLWNMINGCMWGYRIVAGSCQTTDVWEMAPSLLDDEGVYDINHAVTGILDVRSRKYYAVEALSITASMGLLDDESGSTMSLRFSDDQGQTWSAYFTNDLSEGYTTEEIAWRSLGSFNRPGRVFEISDVGGLVRLDGADVFIDSFDEDEPQQGGQQ